MKLLAGLLVISYSFAFGQSISGDVTQGNIHETICVKGWTKTRRPDVGYTSRLKRAMMHRQGIMGSASAFQLDHIEPLELDGAPRDVRNFQLQPIAEAHVKDAVENLLNRQVCRGDITLSEAQRRILHWKDYARTRR